YKQKKERIAEVTHSQYAIKTLDTLFRRPIFNSSDFIKLSGIPKASAMRILHNLKKHNIIIGLRPGKGRRPGIMAFRKLLDIIN
ncbi:MAG: Fic family protein, partial [Sedimentibacter sp.]|nr:Fic family protein [Sedimentibacter sp.]